VLVASSRLLRDVVDVIMERTPRGVDAAALSAELAALPGVAGVHDLHVWALMPGKLLLTVHLDAAPGARSQDVLHAAQRVAHRRLGLAHATIQVEGASA
jgi:cobalt-zinc-cadmium efflux system protein